MDELRVHVVPVLFGAGTRLFDLKEPAQIELELTKCVTSSNATHLRFTFAP